jgi:hypothetical protein
MDKQPSEKTIKHVHEGKYAADVEIMLHYDGSGWDPTIDAKDIEKLDRVRHALRAGDVTSAAREANVFELLPLAVALSQ